jgi:hypothetical protein
MEFKFDPINLIVFPNPGLLFKRSNAFVAGLVLNRTLFEIVSTKISSLTVPLSDLKSTIAKWETWIGWLEMNVKLEPGIKEWILNEIDELEVKVGDSGSEKIPSDKPTSSLDDLRSALLRARNPGIVVLPLSYYAEKDLLGRFILKAKKICDSLKEKFDKEGFLFHLGLILDGAVNGFMDSNSRYFRKLSCEGNCKKGVWQINGSAGKPIPNCQVLTSLPRSFIRRLKTSTGDQLFPFDILKSAAELPPPLEWAEAIVAVWSTLAKEDQDEAGFRRVELNCGEIYLDGQLLGVLPRDNHPYIAFKYIVRELQNDPTAWFVSEKVYREIYKEKPVKASKRKGASKTSSGRPISPKTNSMRGETKTPEYGKLHMEIEKAIGNIFEKIDALNTRKGFTLRLTQFSKAVLT